MNNTEIVTAVLGIEQGYVDDPGDGGGPTNFGITVLALARHRGTPVTADDIKNLTVEEAREIYVDDYIVAPGFDRIADDNLRWAVVDAGVNQGQPTAAKWLQMIARVTIDGNFGPRSAAAINLMPPRRVLARFVAQRCRAYGRTVTDDFKKGGDDAKFAAGWADRLGKFIELLGD